MYASINLQCLVYDALNVCAICRAIRGEHGIVSLEVSNVHMIIVL